jgi:CheY-like chemotaxis protein
VDWADLILDWTGRIAWPLLLGFVLWKLFPAIREVLRTRGFSVKVAGAEITVQEASDQVSERFADLEEQVVALGRRLDEAGSADALAEVEPELVPTPGRVAGVAGPAEPIHRILWVDDQPANNAYAVDSFRKRGYRVEQVRTTDEALRRLADADAVITDLGRDEAGTFHPDAGIELIRRVKASRPELPVYVYTTPDAAAGRAEQLAEEGAAATTASSSELASLLSRESGRRFERAVRRVVESSGAIIEPGAARGLDFVARIDGKRLGLDAKFWASGPPSATELAGIVARRAGVPERLGLDSLVIVVPNGTSVADRYAAGDVRVRTFDELPGELAAPVSRP